MLTQRQIQCVLKWLGLPPNLIDLIRSGQLEQEIERAQRRTDEVNALLDAWEAANPDKAVLMHWYEQRQQWKRDGRPAAPWWQLLHAQQVAPCTLEQLDGTVFKGPAKARYDRYRNDPESWERYREHIRASDRAYMKRKYYAAKNRKNRPAQSEGG